MQNKTVYKILERYELYTRSTKPYQGMPEPHYPLHDKT